MLKLKHILPLAAVVALASCGSSKSASGPRPFEGKITYSVGVSAPEGEDGSMIEAMSSMFPSEMSMAYDGKDFGMQMDGMQAIHIVARTEENMMYMEMAGQKMKRSMADLNSDTAESAKPEITPLEETRTILGLECKGYQIKTEASEMILFVTEEFAMNQPEGLNLGMGGGVAGDIPGTMLYSRATIEQGPMKMVMTFEAIGLEEGKEATTELLTLSEGEYELMEE